MPCPGSGREANAGKAPLRLAGEGPAGAAGEILRRFLPGYLQRHGLDAHRRKVLRALARCRSPDNGANLWRCGGCGALHYAPRSCGDRHCPGCQAERSARWVAHQRQSLLPVRYFHVVFTLPQELHALARAHAETILETLFNAAAETLLTFGRERFGGELGLSALLHTWGQQMNFHPHLHVIVTGGALSADGQRWKSPSQKKYLFPAKALGAMFRGKFIAALQALRLKDALPGLSAPAWSQLQRNLWAHDWVVHAKQPFGGPEQVLSYIGHYTHRVAISNRRIAAIDTEKQTVTFRWRDYAHSSVVRELTLSADEWIGRFVQHILPPRFVKIRHYGILSNNRRKRDIAAAREALQRQGALMPELPQPEMLPPPMCPSCGQAQLILTGFLDHHALWHPLEAGKRLDSS